MRLLVSGSTKSVRRHSQRWPHIVGHLLSPVSWNSIESILQSGLPWAADNAAFSGFDSQRYRRMLKRIAFQLGCLFIVCPDVVADAQATLTLFGEWALEVRGTGQPLAFVGQDGAEGLDLPWNDFDAWFIGGSTAWKLSQASADLAAEAKGRGKWVHCGRVNSFRRIQAAMDMGCDSFDGGSASMFGEVYIPKYCRFIERSKRQAKLFGGPE